jgi:hypothetical protein
VYPASSLPVLLPSRELFLQGEAAHPRAEIDSGTLETLLGKADQELNLRRSLRPEGAPATRRPASAD